MAEEQKDSRQKFIDSLSIDQLLELIDSKVDVLKEKIDELEQQNDHLNELGPDMEIVDDLGIIEYVEPSNLVHQQLMEALERLIKKQGAVIVLKRLEAAVKQANA